MHTYTAYGLGISSDLALPELVPAEKARDVTIRLHKLDRSAGAVTDGKGFFLGETTNVGMFLVRNGCEIFVDPVAGVDEALLRTILLGPVLGVLLRQREFVVLHASGIATHGAAVAFVGGSGWGKSTLALTFHVRGYGVIADDMMAVRLGPHSPVALPGYPHLKLLPDVAVSLGSDLSSLAPLHCQSEKRLCPVNKRFPQGPLPLKRVYVLDVGTDHEIEPLGLQDAFVELLRNSRAVGLISNPDLIRSHFYQCGRLVKEVPIRRLKRKPSLATLSDIARLIEQDLT